MSWIALGASAIGAGGMIGSKFINNDGGGGGGFIPSGQTQSQNKIVQLPDYPEAEGARVNWWDTLQQWGDQSGYGAIAPNWEDIWGNAKNRIRRFYGGGPEGPGAISKVQSNLSRRGMSEQGAAETQLGRLGMHEGNQMQDLAVKMALEEAQFGEKGRETWLNSLMRLAGLKPQFSVGGSTTTNFDFQEPMMSGALSEMGGNLMQGGGTGIEGIDKLLSMFGGGGFGGGGQQEDTGIGDVLGSGIGDIFGSDGGGGGGIAEFLPILLQMFGSGV